MRRTLPKPLTTPSPSTASRSAAVDLRLDARVDDEVQEEREDRHREQQDPGQPAAAKAEELATQEAEHWRLVLGDVEEHVLERALVRDDRARVHAPRGEGAVHVAAAGRLDGDVHTFVRLLHTRDAQQAP
jgi:hypothetical protein